MRSHQLIALSLIASIIAAPASASTIKLSLNQAAEVASALYTLDKGWDSHTADGKTTSTSYMLGGALRLKMSRDARILKTAVEDFRTARQSWALEQKVDVLKPGSPEATRFEIESQRLASVTADYELQTFSVDDLHVGDGSNNTNPIPVAVLSALEPLLTGEVKDEAAKR